jgi:DNA polymerase III delta prime subunit
MKNVWSNINTILNRDSIENEICNLLHNYDKKIEDVNFKRAIFIYGPSGIGKTSFAYNLLKKINYDIVQYDTSDLRNKALFDNIACNNISNKNVLHMFTKTTKKIAIIMDEIEGMNSGDKGGIAALIKLVRQKKTKKQKLENINMNPIICICNNTIDKKIKDLMKVCHVFELKIPTNEQIAQLLYIDERYKNQCIKYIQGDLRKLSQIYDMYNNSMNFDTIFDHIYNKDFNEDSKKNTKILFENNLHISQHQQYINDNERTIISLLWHENVIEFFNNKNKKHDINLYLTLLNNICYADYIDRITFQNQIWLFNEVSSLIKTFYNNKIFHENIKPKPLKEIRFTKILTKYSTEYNNQQFFNNLCFELGIDKKDLICLFNEIKTLFPNNYENLNVFDNDNINKLDIKRMYKFLEKNSLKDDAEN